MGDIHPRQHSLAACPLTLVIAGPQLYLIHHSRLPQHANKNFVAFLPLWTLFSGPTIARRKVNGRDGRPRPRGIRHVWVAATRRFAPGKAILAHLRRAALMRALRNQRRGPVATAGR
jgi:hypothetical protein